MGIRFSPGPCGCCGFAYLAYAQGVSVPFPGQAAMGIGSGVPIDPFVFSSNVFAVLVSDPDLVDDCKQDVFSPSEFGLPLPNDPRTQVAYYGHILPSLKIPGENLVYISKPIGITEVVKIGLFTLRGSKGSWTIVGAKIQTASAELTVMDWTFTVEADGTISQ